MHSEPEYEMHSEVRPCVIISLSPLNLTFTQIMIIDVAGLDPAGPCSACGGEEWADSDARVAHVCDDIGLLLVHKFNDRSQSLSDHR